MLVCLAGALGLASSAVDAGVASAASPPVPAGPAAALGVVSAPLGGTITILGSGWNPALGLVKIDLCGNLALNGSADCDVSNTIDTAIQADGTFRSALRATAPPSPCPCVVRIGYGSNPDLVKLPVEITGVGQRAPQAAPRVRRAVAVLDVRVTGSGPWTSWLGGAPKRTVSYSVRNTGDVVLHNPAVSLNLGRSRNASGFVAAPDVGDLGIGQTKSFTTPLPFGALSAGKYDVVLTVDPVGDLGTGDATTTIVPWGLLAFVAVGLEVGWLRFRRRFHRSRRAPGPEVAALERIAGAEGLGLSAPLPAPVASTEHDWAGPWVPLARVAEGGGPAGVLVSADR